MSNIKFTHISIHPSINQPHHSLTRPSITFIFMPISSICLFTYYLDDNFNVSLLRLNYLDKCYCRDFIISYFYCGCLVLAIAYILLMMMMFYFYFYFLFYFYIFGLLPNTNRIFLLPIYTISLWS